MTDLPALPNHGRELGDQADAIVLPSIVSAAGDEARYHYLNFFIANIRNPNTRRAYARQVRVFCAWCEQRGISDIREIRTPHVAAYIEVLTKDAGDNGVARVKQALSALRMLFDWLVVNQVMRLNPAHAVRGPKLSVSEGATPCLETSDVVAILDAIPTDKLVGLRDRALIGVMAYTFARVGAATAMRVRDYFPQGKHWMIRLHEKGGKRKLIAAHHALVEYLDTYLAEAGLAEAKASPLFRSARGKTDELTENGMSQSDAWRMLQRRARLAGVTTPICNHSWRATSITNFLEHGGALETAQWMAGHADPRTTKLYDRRLQRANVGEVERIRYERGA